MLSYLSYSLDDNVRYKASTGGFCKEFIRFVLENKIVDKAVVTVLGEGSDSLVSKTIITSDVERILSTKSNTIYDKTNPLSVLSKMSSKESYIFVGLPCHILPAKLYCKKRNIKIFTISLFCNHVSNNKYYKSVLDKIGLTKEDVKHFEYRGSGWPGSVRVVSNDNNEIKIDHVKCWDYYSNEYFEMSYKCKKCDKFISLDADICVGDAWIPRIIDKDNKGTCIVIAINTVSDKLIHYCADNDYIYLEKINNVEVDRINKSMLDYKLKRK